MTRRVAVLGSTGSIGTQTLDIVRTANATASAEGLEPPYEVVSIGASGKRADVLAEQVREFDVPLVAVSDSSTVEDVAPLMPSATVVAGDDGFRGACADADVVINGIVGFAGLTVTLETLRLGKRLGLANKESLIAAGPVVAKMRSVPGAEIIPVDSEHCALHQCLRSNESFASNRLDQVRRLIVIASGGPFRGYTRDQLESVTVDEALAHPTWAMGPKITVDSSTLMNKGLEVIEANELFGVGFDRIDVVVHPQSVVHSMVEFTDGATIAQLSLPDMRLCMAYALDYPDRHPVPYGGIDWTELSRLDFAAPDRELFPCLDLAYDAGRRGGTAPATLSGANEIAVEAFLAGRIRWVKIPRVVEAVLSDHHGDDDPDLDAVIAADADARRLASEYLER
ncbi:MAG: 1-deoxy-D-xylulose-5-phosphate reductoisomerase [Actinomycetota bacterium]